MESGDNMIYYRKKLPNKIIAHRKWEPAHIITGLDGANVETKNVLK